MRSEPAVADPLTEEELEKLLVQREKEQAASALAAVDELGEGKLCPVCQAALEVEGPNSFLRRFVDRPSLACGGCGLKTSPRPAWYGWVIVMAFSVALGGFGMQTIFRAQRATGTDYQKLAFAMGALMFGGGVLGGYGINGLGQKKGVGATILKRRRAWKASGGELPEAGAQDKEAGAGWFQENLEAVVVAIILALIIRHFAMEAFVIPTGSMAPTLLGDHFRVECSSCGYPINVSKRDGDFSEGRSKSLRPLCPVCERYFKVEVTPRDVFGGDKILVNKFIYEARSPRRYEIIVFKYPRAPWRNYIKRLIGLPGETLEIINGDIWADGKLQRKPDLVQDSVWMPVHDAAYTRRGEGVHAWWLPVAEEDEPAGVWDYDADGLRMSCKPGLVSGAPPSWIAYQRDGGITDLCSYNVIGPNRGRNRVADLRVRVRVTPQRGAVVRLAIHEGTKDPEGRQYERAVVGRFGVGAGQQTFGIEIDGKLEAQVERPGLTPGKPVELTLAYADDRARLQIDGRTIFAWDDPYGPTTRTATSNVRLSAAGAAVLFEHVRIDRDLFYVSSTGSEFDPGVGPVRVPDDSFFAMGDNSPNSADGREWGFVNEGNMIGRAFVVFWPIRPFELKFIR